VPVRSSPSLSNLPLEVHELTRIAPAAIGRLHFTPDNLADNVHTLLASVSDIALGGSGTVNGVPARVKRRASPSLSLSLRPRVPQADAAARSPAAAITRVLISSTQGPGIELADL